MGDIEENFYELYKNEKERIIILKECESEDDARKSIASFDSEEFDIEEEKNDILKKSKSKESTLDEDLEIKFNLKFVSQNNY